MGKAKNAPLRAPSTPPSARQRALRLQPRRRAACCSIQRPCPRWSPPFRLCQPSGGRKAPAPPAARRRRCLRACHGCRCAPRGAWLRFSASTRARRHATRLQPLTGLGLGLAPPPQARFRGTHQLRSATLPALRRAAAAAPPPPRRRGARAGASRPSGATPDAPAAQRWRFARRAWRRCPRWRRLS